MKTNQVNKTSAEVAAFNTANAESISLGLVAPEEQSPQAVADEAKAIKHGKDDWRWDVNGLFNTSIELWRNAQSSYRERGIHLMVADGHVVAGSDGVVARFENDISACAVLELAGYVRDPVCQNIIFDPPKGAAL